MSEQNQTYSGKTENYDKGRSRTCKKGYVVVIMNNEGLIKDTPFATFDKALAEEIALEYAWEEMWLCWYKRVHFLPTGRVGAVSSIYFNKLTHFNVDVKEITWYG